MKFKLSLKTKEFICCMLVIPMIAAFVGFVLVSEGPVASSTPSRTTTISSPRGANVPKGPANITDRSGTETALAQPGTDTAVSKPAAPVKTPTANQRGGVKSGYMQAHELFELMDKSPQSIAWITFLNGSDRVTVVKTGDATKYFVTLPEKGGREEVLRVAREQSILWKAEDDSTSTLRNFAFSFGPIILIALLFMFFMRGRMGGAGKIGGFGKSRMTSSDEEGALRKVTFSDVAGCEEAVKELRRIAKGLKWRRLYSWFGAKLPKGVMLVGPPGTGKTLLARAVAGETDGTFDATSGSDFIEMLVGVGASRVRDMFETGRRKVKETGKPHIIFIDEIDAVGGKRGGGASGVSKNEEREQTLNALLVEMDGMKNNEGLIIIAATNRVDMLDEALLRPGRFDSVVDVDLPNKEGRTAIFRIHTRHKPIAEDVNCARLAERSWGYSGAEIEGACNRAALNAAERYGLELPETPDDKALDDKVIEDFLKAANAVISMEDFQEGIDFIRFGATNQSRQNGMTEFDKENTTVHEAGHAIVSDVMPGMDPIVKITNVNRSKALGYVQNMPAEDRYSINFQQLVGRIVMAMAGRVAQEVVLGQADTGAANDFEQASNYAYNMVTKWGMSRVGHISVGRGGGSSMRGMGGSGPIQNYGPKLADEIDDEWRRIVEECYDMAVRIVNEDRARLDALVKKLKEEETIDADGWIAFAKEHPSKVDKKTLVLDISRPKKGAA